MLVAGVDGCPGGWILVCAQAGGFLRLLSVRVVRSFGEVLERTRDCERLGIDIPIGLSDDGRRLADIEARRVLRPLRHNSVFPAPIRPVLRAPTYKEASDLSAKLHVDGKRISKQTYFLSFKIDEVDRLMDAAAQQRVAEVHPEVCFWALNGGQPLLHPKRTAVGQGERLELLSGVFADDLSSVEIPARAARDDFYDACAAAWTAWRCAKDEAQRFPEHPPLDSRGLRMEIVY